MTETVGGWRFDDRGWFVNDGVDLRSDANRRVVAAELEFPNVVFGIHRWFAGGASPSLVAFTTAEQYEAELDRSRPGDNLLLLSLRLVAEEAIARAGSLTSHEPPGLRRSDVARVNAFLSDAGNSLAVVQRSSPRPGEIRCAYRSIPTHPPVEWEGELGAMGRTGGEIWLFDDDVVWRDHERRQLAPGPPEEWTARHGRYLVDGYVPDERGRVVCGGPY